MKTAQPATRTARRSRFLSRAPRIVLIATACILSVTGVRSTLASQPRAVVARATAPVGDLAAEAMAERFAWAYLDTDPNQPGLRERALAALPSGGDNGQDSDPGRRPVQVVWTAAVGDRRRGSTHLITVAAATNTGTVHLEVPVVRERRGLLAIDGPPAFVGGPPLAQRAPPDHDRDAVEDAELKAVVGRVVRNYLAGQRGNLAADLAPEAVVSLPNQKLEVQSIEQTVWLKRPSAVAVDVRAADQTTGARHLLRYDLAASRRSGRWQVTAIGDTPPGPNEGGAP